MILRYIRDVYTLGMCGMEVHLKDFGEEAGADFLAGEVVETVEPGDGVSQGLIAGACHTAFGLGGRRRRGRRRRGRSRRRGVLWLRVVGRALPIRNVPN